MQDQMMDRVAVLRRAREIFLSIPHHRASLIDALKVASRELGWSGPKFGLQAWVRQAARESDSDPEWRIKALDRAIEIAVQAAQMETENAKKAPAGPAREPAGA